MALNPARLADWAEAAVLVERRRSVPGADLRDRLLSAGMDQSDVDTALEDAFGEVEWRSRASDAYPFSRDGDRLVRRTDRDATLYYFLLMLSVSGRAVRPPTSREAGQLFDVLVAAALRELLGQRSRAALFGFPPFGRGARPTGFAAAVIWLGDLMSVPVGPARLRSARKDGGVDVVGWVPFADKRTGFPVLLAQATLQRKWHLKAGDIRTSLWNGYLDFGAEPLIALAVPFAAEDIDQWDEVRRIANVVIDRLRLVELITLARLGGRTAVRRWTQRERTALSRRVPTRTRAGRKR